MEWVQFGSRTALALAWGACYLAGIWTVYQAWKEGRALGWFRSPQTGVEFSVNYR